MVSTWDHGLPANVEAMKVIQNGGSALEAVISGCKKTETLNG